MEYVLADLWQLQQYQVAFEGDRQRLRTLVATIDQLLTSQEYGLVDVRDGVVALHRNAVTSPEARSAWSAYRQEIEPVLQ